MNNILVFYAGLLYGEYPVTNQSNPLPGIHLPDGAYIRLPDPQYAHQWFRSDFTPVLPSDVPKELLLLTLLLT